MVGGNRLVVRKKAKGPAQAKLGRGRRRYLLLQDQHARLVGLDYTGDLRRADDRTAGSALPRVGRVGDQEGSRAGNRRVPSVGHGLRLIPGEISLAGSRDAACDPPGGITTASEGYFT